MVVTLPGERLETFGSQLNNTALVYARARGPRLAFTAALMRWAGPPQLIRLMAIG